MHLSAEVTSAIPQTRYAPGTYRCPPVFIGRGHQSLVVKAAKLAGRRESMNSSWVILGYPTTADERGATWRHGATPVQIRATRRRASCWDTVLFSCCFLRVRHTRFSHVRTRRARFVWHSAAARPGSIRCSDLCPHAGNVFIFVTEARNEHRETVHEQGSMRFRQLRYFFKIVEAAVSRAPPRQFTLRSRPDGDLTLWPRG